MEIGCFLTKEGLKEYVKSMGTKEGEKEKEISRNRGLKMLGSMIS